tara:strand:+ start:240 stop:509 length:270 start_codon:yes stop_codon:yes gene_type:complete
MIDGKHKITAPRRVKVSNPFKFIEIDIFLEKPVRFFNRSLNEIKFRGGISRYRVYNIGALHISLESFKAPENIKEKAREVFDKTTSGDG